MECFEHPNQASSLFSTQDMIGRISETEAISAYIFKIPIHTRKHL
jgi:hypothetical protein